MQLLQDLLLFGVVDGGILGDIVGNVPRVLGGQHRRQAVLGRASGQLQEVVIEDLSLADHGLYLGGGLGIGLVCHRLHAAIEVRLHLDALRDSGTVLPFHQNAKAIPRQLENLLDGADSADGIEFAEVRVIGLNVLLRHQKDFLVVVAHGLLDGADRLLPSHIEMNGHGWKYVESPQRQNRQPLG